MTCPSSFVVNVGLETSERSMRAMADNVTGCCIMGWNYSQVGGVIEVTSELPKTPNTKYILHPTNVLYLCDQTSKSHVLFFIQPEQNKNLYIVVAVYEKPWRMYTVCTAKLYRQKTMFKCIHIIYESKSQIVPWNIFWLGIPQPVYNLERHKPFSTNE